MKLFSKKSLGVLVPVLAVVLLLSGCVNQAQTPKTMETIKIGVIAPMSGDAAAYGEQIQRVIDSYLPKLNEDAKVDGKQFQFIYEDGKCGGSEAVSAFQKLKDIDGVKFVIGGACSSETLGIAPLTKDGSVLVTSAFSSNPAIEGASPYTFTFSYSDDVIGKTIAKEMSKYERVALITEQNDWNVGVQKVVLDEFKANYPKVTVVANETYPKGATDMRSVLEKIKKMAPAAILLNPTPGVTAETLVKQMAEIKDWPGTTIFGQYSYISETALAAAPALTNGMIIIDAPKVNNVELTAFIDSVTKEKGPLTDIGNFYTASLLDDVKVVTGLIRELGNDQAAVQKALKQRTFSGYISNNISFKDSSFPGVGGGIYIVKDGKAEYQQ